MRTFEVRIKTEAEARADFIAAFKLAEAGKPGPGDQGVFFTNYEAARSLFTDKRIELLRLIRKHAPTSINQLARIAGRNFKNVHTDVMLFKKLDIVRVPRGKHAGEPLTVLYDAFNLHAVV
jgi:predicted transcriptional regulator